MKRALLIGIDEYPTAPLDGCVNDVLLMRSILLENFAFEADRVTVLTNAEATRDGILDAVARLVADTLVDDVVVVHYSGHGSQMTDREGDEPSGFDSTLVPIDSEGSGGQNRDITDDEIQLAIEALAEKTSHITLIFDACHSGTMSRNAFGPKARGVEPDRRPIAELPPSPIPADRQGAARASGPSGWMPLAGKYVLIAASRDEERSYEYLPPEGDGDVVHGALTYFLCEQLRQVRSGTTYRDVFEPAAANVTAEETLQHPQMEGTADRELFGLADAVPSRFVRVSDRDEQVVTLAAGTAHGMTAGSTYEVFEHGTKRTDEAESIGALVVVKAHVVTSAARVTSERRPGAIGAGARAFESVHAFGDFRLAVALGRTRDAGPYADALRGALDASPFLKMVEPGDATAAARVELVEPHSLWAARGAAGALLMPFKRLGDERTVCENLETIARYRHALALENPDTASPMRGRFALELLRLVGQSWVTAQTDTDRGLVVFDEGDAFACRIVSAHDAPAYISLVDFGLTGKVSPVYPALGAQEKLAKGMTFDVGTQAKPPVQLEWPDGYPFEEAGRDERRAEGIETIKLFVTQEPANFAFLQQSGVRSIQTLPALLRGVFHGTATRSTRSAVGTEDWTTVARSFVLRRRVMGRV